jgi:hypothetical protein
MTTTYADTDRSEPRSFRRKIADAATSQINDQKTRLASRAGDVAYAVRQTAAQLREASPGVAIYVDRAADRLDEWVAALRNRDAAQLMDDVRDVARRHPALIVGGGFALGLLAARFLKSSGREADRRRYHYTSEGSLT